MNQPSLYFKLRTRAKNTALRLFYKVILYYDVSTRLTKCDLLIEDCEWHCILNLLPKFLCVCVLMNECEEKKNKTDAEYICCFI